MDLDQRMNLFRVSSRELFNNYFRLEDKSGFKGAPPSERFAQVQELLFRKMVTEPLGIPEMRYFYRNAQPNIIVQLQNRDSLKALINREFESGYWDYPVNRVTNETVMLFEVFDDFGSTEFCDNQLVRAQIVHWSAQPDTQGKDVLLEAGNVRYVYAEPGMFGLDQAKT